MLNMDTARKIGVNACIDKLGRNYVLTHKDSAASAYGQTPNGVFCFVGVGDVASAPLPENVLVLDSMSKFPYHASCIVDLHSGIPAFRECVLPSAEIK